MKFCETIYNLRKKLRLSQSEFGRLIFVSNKVVSKWELGEALPNIEVLSTISRTFNISTDVLLGLINDGEEELIGLANESDNKPSVCKRQKKLTRRE